MNRLFVASALVFGFGISAVVAGCSSDGGSGGSGGSSGPKQVTTLEPSKDVASLTPAEQDQYCREVGEYYRGQFSATDAQRFACTFMATALSSGETTNAQAREKCRATFDQCMKNPPKGDAPSTPAPGTGSTCDLKERAAGCTGITVGEFSACASDQLALLKAAVAAGCDGVDVEKPAEAQEPSAACKAVADKCKTATVPGETDGTDGN